MYFIWLNVFAEKQKDLITNSLGREDITNSKAKKPRRRFKWFYIVFNR